MTQTPETTPAETLAGSLVKFLQRDGIPGKRPVHAWGSGASGFFVPSQVAGTYCIAEHFQERLQDGSPNKPQRVPVTVRFSNGSGSRQNNGAAKRHDGWSDVRGMATRFHLGSGAATDLIAMSLPEFFTPTPETFLDFAKDAVPKPCKRETPWQKLRDMLKLTLPLPDPYPGQDARPDEGAMGYANRNASAQLAVFQAAAMGAPVSYVRETYHAVHTFFVIAPDGTRRGVRFTWQPISGAANINPLDPAQQHLLTEPYLQQELCNRLAQGPARFSLMMMIGETGDDFNNSTRPWPPHRVRVMMGTLTVDRTIDCEDLSFNPLLLCDGIEPSEDPVLAVRNWAYRISSHDRHGVPCPFSGK